MEENITITELLNRIKRQRKIVLETDHKYLDKEESKKAKSLISLYNPSRNTTINGSSINETSEDIRIQYNNIVFNINKLRNLLIIKEQVNSSFKLVVPDIILGDFNSKPLTISQILILKSPMIKEYYIKFAERIKDDIDFVNSTLKKYNESTLSDDKINTYVLTKLNTLKINVDFDKLNSLLSIPQYKDFAKEYEDANKLEILDPLNLLKESNKLIDNIYDFYNTIDLKLLEFNSSTKIWIDESTGSWHYN